jgi:hypothetical protein
MKQKTWIPGALQNPENLIGLTLAEWDRLIRQGRQANLLATLYSLLNERGLLERVPAQPRLHLEWADAAAQRHTLAVQHEVEQIQKALSQLDITVILLKGAAYVMAKLPAAQGRIFSDIDILVAKDHLNAVEAALMLHGWASTHHDIYDQHYYRNWMHEIPPMQHRKRLTVIDVHHAILPKTAAIHPDPDKLRASAHTLEGHCKLAVLSPVDLVLHSACHLFHASEMEHGLRDLGDIDSLLRHFSSKPAFWSELIKRAQELELSRPLFYALRYSTQLLHTPLPADTQIAGPNPLLLALMDELFIRQLLASHPRSWIYRAAHSLIYLRANWQRMPPLLLFRHLFHKAFISPKIE